MAEYEKNTPSRGEVKFEGMDEAMEIATFIQELQKGFKKGKLTLGENGESMEFQPGGLISMQVRAKKKRGENKISLKLKWKDSKEKNRLKGPTVDI